MKITKKVWVIMDKGHKAIATGVPRNRTLVMIDTWDGHRLLTYKSKAKAELGFKVSQFYLGNAEDYMNKTYNAERNEYTTSQGEQRVYYTLQQSSRYKELYEAVEVDVILDTGTL